MGTFEWHGPGMEPHMHVQVALVSERFATDMTTDPSLPVLHGSQCYRALTAQISGKKNIQRIHFRGKYPCFAGVA